MPTLTTTSMGTKLQFSASSPISYADIPGIQGFKLSVVKPEYEDTTNLGSTGGYRERLPIMKDGDKFTAVMFLDPATPNATQLALQTAAIAQTLGYFKVIPQGGGTGMAAYTFTAYLGFAITYATAKVQTAEVEVQITGPVTPA